MSGQNWMCDLQNKPMVCGVVSLSVGLLMLLHTFGFLEKGITFLMLLVALGLIWYGLMLTGLWGMMKSWFVKK